jgi:phage shock protein PspC (stress-responsive transcriptional regulator)
MDKITRIHIAKVPYEIGADAEHTLRKYLDDIRDELDAELADEIMADIETRITEILSDRTIHRDGIITDGDITAIRDQLGSPEQFTDHEDTDTKQQAAQSQGKRLFRDTDNAYIGGVASGIGAYFAIDPLFIRLAFIGLTFVSGLGIIMYVLLWLLVPDAKTSSDKLQMRGKPVTVAALQQYRSTAQRTVASLRIKAVARVICKAARLLFTVAVAGFVLVLLSAIGIGTAALYTKPLSQLYHAYHLNYVLLGLLWTVVLMVVGILFVSLLRIWGRRSALLKITVATLAGVLVLTLAGVATVSPFIVNYYKDQYGGNRLQVAIPVHQTTAITPANLIVDADRNLVVSYQVTTQPLHATYQSYPGMNPPDISITNKGGTLTVQATQLSNVAPSCLLDWCRQVYVPVHMTLYGPALQKFSVNGGAELDFGDTTTNNITLTAQHGSNLTIGNSYGSNLIIDAQSGAIIDASDTTAQSATITVDSNSMVFGPATNALHVAIPASCDQTILLLAQMPSSITLNSQSITAQAFEQNQCIGLNGPAPMADGVHERIRPFMPMKP